jgi:hypothetical protein
VSAGYIKKYRRHESRYIYLAGLAARPPQPCTVGDFAIDTLNLSAVLHSMFEEQEEARARILRDFTAHQEEWQRLLNQVGRLTALDLPKPRVGLLPELRFSNPLSELRFDDPALEGLAGIFGKRPARES